MNKKDDLAFDTTSISSDLKLANNSIDKSFNTLENRFLEENEKQDLQIENLGILKQEVNQFLNLLQNFKNKQVFANNFSKKSQASAQQLLAKIQNTANNASAQERVVKEIKTEPNLVSESLFTIFSETEKDSRQSDKNSQNSSHSMLIPENGSATNIANLV